MSHPDPAEARVATASAAADSLYAPAALIVAFRDRVPGRPTQLGGGATTSLDSLLARYAHAVERADTAALRSLVLTPSEFAWLYYLDSPMAQTPYELDPETMWLQIRSRGEQGEARALALLGGKPLGAWRHACGAFRTSGALSLVDCTITLGGRGGAADTALRLSIVGREGRYKLVSLATSL